MLTDLTSGSDKDTKEDGGVNEDNPLWQHELGMSTAEDALLNPEFSSD